MPSSMLPGDEFPHIGFQPPRRHFQHLVPQVCVCVCVCVCRLPRPQLPHVSFQPPKLDVQHLAPQVCVSATKTAQLLAKPLLSAPPCAPLSSGRYAAVAARGVIRPSAGWPCRKGTWDESLATRPWPTLAMPPAGPPLGTRSPGEAHEVPAPQHTECFLPATRHAGRHAPRDKATCRHKTCLRHSLFRSNACGYATRQNPQRAPLGTRSPQGKAHEVLALQHKC